MSEVSFLYPEKEMMTCAEDEDGDGCPDPSAERNDLSESGNGNPSGWLNENQRILCPAGGGDCRTSGALPESSDVHAVQTAGEDSIRDREEN